MEKVQYGYRQSHWAWLTVTVCICSLHGWECAWVHYRGGSLRDDSMTDGWLKQVWSDQWASAPLKQEANQWVVWYSVSSKQTKKTFCSNQNKLKQDLFWLCFGLFCETKKKISVCFGISNLYRNNWNKQNCFEASRNNPKFSEKYLNMLSIKLFWLVFCLFRFNRNIETLCFGIEPKQPNKLFWKKPKQTETTTIF